MSRTTPLEDRPERTRLLRDAHAQEPDHALVYRLDRLEASTRNSVEVHHPHQELNIGLVSMTESFDSSTPTGKMGPTMLVQSRRSSVTPSPN